MLGGVLGLPSRLASTARNLVEVARFGGLETGEQPTPYELVAQRPIYRLRRYPGDADDALAPLLLIPPLMLTAEVWDVSPQASAVRALLGGRIDPWVIDFGSPEREAGGLQRTLEDHVLAISEAVDTVRATTGKDPILVGYSQGGMFCYQVAAYRRSDGIAGLITFGSPVDPRGALPLGIPEEVGVLAAQLLAGGVFRYGVPGWMTRTGFRMLDPIGSVRQRLEFLLQLHDRESLLPREGQRRYLMGEGWVAWPGPALGDFVEQFLRHRRMLEGGLIIGGRPATLADIRCPVLYFVGETDEIAPAASVRALRRAAPRAELFEAGVPAGHFGLVVGRAAAARSWPTVIEWVRWRSGQAELPAAAVRVAGQDEARGRSASPVTVAVEAAAELTALVGSRVTRTASAVLGLAGTAAVELPRLNRLANAREDTRISLALLLDEQARRNPAGHFFLFGDRAYTHREVKDRVDGLARGLVARGIEPGDRIGVLMDTRPTAVAIVAALNRIGAVAVLLRPDGDCAEEARLAGISRLVVDPAHERAATSVEVPVHVFLLAPEKQDVELEQAEFDANPGRADQLAFVLFTGRPGSAEPVEITNGRWALSALGTASAAALREDDTIYSLNPLHHPSGLLTGVGGAVAAGARLAMADGETPFWDEVRRYGVTVVSYTWAQLRAVADGPQTRAEHHNAVRLFLGSGMPLAVWRRLEQRLPGASVLEFFVAPAGGALLANVRGAKQGSVGRPMPGTTGVELARYDLVEDALDEAPDGGAIVCRPGEIGMLLVSAPGTGTLRDVFRRGDAWSPSDALFRRDADGDYWYLGSLATAIRTPDGLVLPNAITAALEALPAVDVVVTYPGRDQTPVAALAVLPDQVVTAGDVDRALAELAPQHRPASVTLVPSIPLNQWGRPQPPTARGRTIWTAKKVETAS